MKNKFVTVLTASVVALIVVAAVYFDYHVWELKHPDAPVWTYFVK